MSWLPSRGWSGTRGGGSGAGAVGETSLPARRVADCAPQDGLVQTVAGALPGDPIKVDPGAPGLALDCVYRRSRTDHADTLP